MKAMLLSIKPKWVAKIFNGEKTIEIRKQFPKDFVGWVYIYCTKDNDKNFIKECWTNSYVNWAKEVAIGDSILLNGKVVARFWCDKVEEYVNGGNWTRYEQDKKYNGVLDFTDYLNDDVLGKSCLTEDELYDYCDDLSFSAIYITKLEIFDKPKELSEFKHIKPSVCGVKDNNGLYQCDKCKYGHSEFWHCECRLPLTKAPKGYCYVEVEE